MSKHTVINVTLTISDDAQGNGNTGGGNYRYDFAPDVVHVRDKDTEIVYAIAEKDRPRYRMVNMYVTDVNKQIGHPQISDYEISATHHNSKRQLTIVSIRVQDTEADLLMGCDPQVTNDPPPVLP
jgi:hypothetical protein